MTFKKHKIKKKFPDQTLLKYKHKNLYNELINIGAFVGAHRNQTHWSQQAVVQGYKGLYSFRNLHKGVGGLKKALYFLRASVKIKPRLRLVFVGHPHGCKQELQKLFERKLYIDFFPNNEWSPGFLSKYKKNAVLIYYSNPDTDADAAMREATTNNYPVVGFLSATSEVRGVDYPVLLNLDHAGMWYYYLWKTFLNNL